MRRRNFVVVVTGASSGIGRATALRFARKGAKVVLAARRGEALEELAAECERLGGEAVAVPTDVSDAEAVQRLAERAVGRFGRIDVWINNAAVAFFAPFLDVPLGDFRRVMDVNVMGYVHGCRAALEQMQAQESGVIVNVSSLVGEIAQPYTAAYSMSKAAIRALGVSLRSELRLAGRNRSKSALYCQQPLIRPSLSMEPTTLAARRSPCLRSTHLKKQPARLSTSHFRRVQKQSSDRWDVLWHCSIGSLRAPWRP